MFRGPANALFYSDPLCKKRSKDGKDPMPDNQNKSGGFERNPSILSLLTKTQLVDFVEKLFLNEGIIETLSLHQKFLRRFI